MRLPGRLEAGRVGASVEERGRRPRSRSTPGGIHRARSPGGPARRRRRRSTRCAGRARATRCASCPRFRPRSGRRSRGPPRHRRRACRRDPARARARTGSRRARTASPRCWSSERPRSYKRGSPCRRRATLVLGPVAQWIERRTSNPRAEVRLLPGPSRLFMRNPVCDAGYMELRGAGPRPLKTARDRLSEARTGAHTADERLKRDSFGALPTGAHSPRSSAAVRTSARRRSRSGPRRPSPQRADRVTAARRGSSCEEKVSRRRE
jgi:hypothetical protein